MRRTWLPIVALASLVALAAPVRAAEPKTKKQRENAKIAAVARAKQEFVLRVDPCVPADRCDREALGFIEASEKKFVDACRECTTDERCEAERKLIRAGKAKRTVNPCAQP